MIRKYVLSILAVAGVVLAMYTVQAGNRPTPAAAPVVQPSQAPFESFVAGAGIVEASTRNIAIGTPTAGLITQVFVEAGEAVKRGQPLFKLDDRDLVAQLAVKQAALDTANAQLQKLLQYPRAEDLPPAESRVQAAQRSLADLQSQLAMWESVTDKRALSEDEFDRRRFAVQVAQARLDEAKANLTLLKAGSWKPDILIAQAQVASGKAQLDQTQTDIERLTIRAPVDGQVLQSNVRAGEYAVAGGAETPLMLLGNTEPLHVRVDVDENDAWRIKQGAAAMAVLRGNSQFKTKMQFVRFEPYVVPKRSLTGGGTERVDTRVLQVIYSFSRGDLPVYVGQLMDVFIDAPPLPTDAGNVVAQESQPFTPNREKP